MRKIKILFLVPNLNIGGAERTIVNLLNGIDKNKFICKLILYQKEGELLKKLKPHTKVINLSVSNSGLAILKITKHLNIEKPDVVFSTLRYPNAAMYISSKLCTSNPKVIIRETNNFTAAGLKVNPLEIFVSWCYRNADKVISLSKGVALDLRKRHQISKNKIKVIYNPVDTNYIRKEGKKKLNIKIPRDFSKKSKFNMISVGSLEIQKGHDILIKSLKKIKNIDFYLFIVGKGSQQKSLQRLIDDCKLSDRIFLTGELKNPYNLISRSDLFVLPSRWEGFGHVIVESMALGTPVLSSNCKSGPNEIITNNINGKLFSLNSQTALIKAIQDIYKDIKLRKLLSKNGKIQAEKYNISKITNEYQKEFLNI